MLITFLALFLGYQWLYMKPGIFHRDISVNNMMYRKKDGKVFGVLNDYDLAIFKSNNAPSSKTRTGTKPFMAIDLLGNPDDVHCYRHDLESMFYVIVYVTSRYHEGQELDDPPLQLPVADGRSSLIRHILNYLACSKPKETTIQKKAFPTGPSLERLSTPPLSPSFKT
jgi:serine/threonine protein kinase